MTPHFWKTFRNRCLGRSPSGVQRRREGRVRRKWTLPIPPPTPVSPNHTLHAGVGEAGGSDKMPVASMCIPVVGPGRPLPHPHSSPLRAPWLPSPPDPTPHPPPDPSPPPSSAPPGRGNRDCGLQEPHLPHWGHVLPAAPAPGGGITRRPLALLNPLSLKCKELWNQTVSRSNLGCLFLAGSAPRFREADLRASGRGSQTQVPIRSWRVTGVARRGTLSPSESPA